MRQEEKNLKAETKRKEEKEALRRKQKEVEDEAVKNEPDEAIEDFIKTIYPTPRSTSVAIQTDNMQLEDVDETDSTQTSGSQHSSSNRENIKLDKKFIVQPEAMTTRRPWRY